MVAMTGLAGDIAKRTMNATGNMGGFVGVARCTIHLQDFGEVRIILDRAVAVDAGKNAMDAGCMPDGVKRDALALVGGHACLAVASQATFVLLQGLRQLRLCPGTGVHRDSDGKKTGQDK